MDLLVLFGFATIYLLIFIFSLKLSNNTLCNILFFISDIILLYFTLFLYEYPGLLGIIADSWILICIIINIIFFLRCIIKRQFIYLLLTIVPIILVVLINNRFDKTVLIYSKLFNAKLENNEMKISNKKNAVRFTYDGNTLYLFYNFDKYDTLEVTDLVDPICAIIYDKNDSLNNFLAYDRNVKLNGVDEYILIIRVLKKLEKNWYFCVNYLTK
jgi:hypothetical protein